MENQADIKIGVQYDGEGAERALLDLEKIPESARDLAGELNGSAMAVNKLQAAMERSTEALQKNLEGMDTSSAEYAKAAAQADSYIAKQTVLRQQAEKENAALAQQADALAKLARQLKAGVITQEEFAEGCDAIGEKAVQAEMNIEKLSAQVRALASRQQAQALENLKVPTVTPRAMASWSGFFTNLKQGFASGTLGVSQFLTAAGGFLRIGAWGAVAKVALEGIGQAASHIREKLGLAENKAISFGNVLKGFITTAAAGLARPFNALADSFASSDSWLGKIISKCHEVVGTFASIGAHEEEIQKGLAEADALERQLQEQQKNRYEEARKSLLDGTVEAFAGSLQATIDAAKAAAEEQKRLAQESYELEQQKLAERAQALELQTKAAEEELELAKARGEIDQETAAARLAAIEEEHARRMADIQEEEAALKVALADDMRSAGEGFAEALQEALSSEDLQKFAPVLEVKLPDEERIREVQMELNAANSKLSEEARQALYDEQRTIMDQARQIASLFTAIDSSLRPAPEEALDMARRLQELNKSLEEQQKSAEEQAEALDQSAAAAREEAKLTEEKTDAARQSARTARSLAQEEATSANRAKEWRAQQEKTLGEQKEWLQRTLSALKEGSEEWEKYNAELRQVNAAGVAESLQKLEETYKTSANYAEQDNRTAAQKLAADRRMLEEKERYLQALAATPNMDAATAARVNDALAACQRELVAYKDSISANKQAAQRQLEEWQPLGLKATNAGLQGNLRRMEKAYAELAKKAEEAAQKGDEEAVNRYRKEMEKLALNIEKISGYTGQQAEQHQQLMAALEVALQGANGLSANEEQIKRIHAALGDLAEAADITARGQRRMGEAAEEGANAALKISTGLEETASTVQETQANIRKSGEAFEKAQQVAVDLGDGLGDIGAAQENLVSAYQELSDSISAELNPTGGNAGAKAEAAQEKAADATEQKAEAEQDAAAAAQRSAAAAGRSAAADEQLAAAKEQQAAAATAAAAQSQQETAAAADPAALQAAIDALNATVQEQNAQLAAISTGLTTCNASLTQANTTMGQIATGIQQLGTAAAQAASAAASGLSAVQASLASLKNELTNLERQVDKIMRP